MFKVSRLADYAMVALSHLSGEAAPMSAQALAGVSKLPEPTVAKVLKLLARGGVVSSVRGANGGYALARDVSAITVADVIAAIEGDLHLTSCVEGASEECDFASSCSMKGRWDGVNDAVLKALENVSLSDMVAPINNNSADNINEEEARYGSN